MMTEDIAIAHEHYPERGGGEHVAEHLARTFDAPIYTGFVGHGVSIPDDVEVQDLFGHGLTGALIRRSVLARDAFYQFAWQDVEGLHDYDVVIQSGNNPGWYVPRDDQAVVKYVHSTLRNPYDLFHLTDSPITKAYSHAARVLYSHTTSYPDVFVCNSELVARRVELYWGIPRDSDRVRVVYPPVDTASYGPGHAERGRGDYYFTYSRLHPAKRFDEIIKAFNQTDKQLLIGGSGPERERLEAMADDNIEFVGYVSEDKKRALAAGATAGIFAAENEDFGLVPVEFLASETPVIGVRDGYTQYQIRDGLNGHLYDRGVANLYDAIQRHESGGVEWSADEIATDAERYDTESFRSGMRKAVAHARERAEIEVGGV